MRRKSDPSYLRRHGTNSLLMNTSNYAGIGGYYGNEVLNNTELAKHAIASRSVTSVDLAANALFNGNLLSRKNNGSGGTVTSSAGSIVSGFKESRNTAQRYFKAIFFRVLKTFTLK